MRPITVKLCDEVVISVDRWRRLSIKPLPHISFQRMQKASHEYISSSIAPYASIWSQTLSMWSSMEVANTPSNLGTYLKYLSGMSCRAPWIRYKSKGYPLAFLPKILGFCGGGAFWFPLVFVPAIGLDEVEGDPKGWLERTMGLDTCLFFLT